MTESEFREVVSSHETDRIEFTVSTKDTDKFSEAVCAFANDLPNSGRPGYLLIGVSDSGVPSGLQVTDELLRKLADLRDAGNIQPLPYITVERLSLPDGDVAIVTVQPSPLPPVRYKGRVCIRNGPRRAYATQPEEQKLTERRISHARTFDAQPCLGSELTAMSEALFLLDYRQHVVAREIIEENHRSLAQQLASLRFYDARNACLTNAGILLFGLDVRQWLPGAYVQFLRVAGESLADDITTERELSGDLFTVLRELDALIDAQLTYAPEASSLLTETTSVSYPRVAVRELVMNGIMHRDYSSTAPLRITWFSDRLEIQSPGGLYGEASLENFPNQNSYRNPIVAEALKALGYVNRYGRGVLRTQAILAKNGNPQAAFQLADHYVLATIRGKRT